MGSVITPVMIVRDEERYLPGALESLRPLAPVVSAPCVYDTGSSDRTVALAESGGARVERGYWDDDFARARNAAAEMARTDWVLSLDADERVESDVDALTRVITSARARSLDCFVIEVDDVRAGRPVNTAPIIRLYRRSRASLENRLHEYVHPRHSERLRAERLPREILRIDHVSYDDPAKSATRRRRNLHIAELDLADARRTGDADRVTEALVNHGRSAALDGRHEQAVSDWREARQVAPSSPFALYAGELLVEYHLSVHDLRAAANLLRSLSEEGLDPSMVAWLTARLYAAAGRPDDVVRCLDTIAPPISALGETASVAPVIQTRMLAAAEIGMTKRATDDAITLMTEHGVYGFARLLMLLWGDRSPSQLAARLASDDRRNLQLADEFAGLGPGGAPIADELRRCGRTGLVAGSFMKPAE